MSLVVFQVGDFHFSTNKKENPILDKQELFFAALRNNVNTDDNVVVIFCGDIADWGKPEEYSMAGEFIRAMDSCILAATGKKVLHVLVPGNHDLDFGIPEEDIELREMILKQVGPNEEMTPTQIRYCLKPQMAYRQFVDQLKSEIELIACESLVDVFSIDIDEVSLNFCLINSAHISQAKEPYGEMWLPLKEIKESFSKLTGPSSISITVMHHPYPWYKQEHKKEIRALFEEYSDLVFTGHEHAPDQFAKARNASEQHLYIEGGVIQDFDDLYTCNFNKLVIDRFKNQFAASTIGFSNGEFSILKDPSEHKFLRFRQQIINGIVVNPDWEEWLAQVGTDFKHPRIQLKLSDIFVYPDLQLLNINKSCKPTGIIRDGEVLGFIQEKKHVCIAGAEKSGKTSLAKSLFLDLTSGGYIPVLIGADFAVAKSQKKTFYERLREAFETRVKEIYDDSCQARVWSIEPKNRALIIDNYDEIGMNFTAREELLKWSASVFGIIIVLTSPGIRFAEILAQHETDAILLSYEHANILEADQETTHLLIRHWLWAGCDRYSVSKDEIHRTTIRYGQAIRGLIGQGIVPSLPLYILMMIQQLDANGTLDGTNGLYGSMYEKIIRDVLVTGSYNNSDFEVKFNYLTELAFHLYSKSIRVLEREAYIEWHKNYCIEYGQELDSEAMLDSFCGIGVFRKDRTEIGFKYRYYYCFFVARYISIHMYDPAMGPVVQSMSRSLFITDHANIMVFICHLQKDPKILGLILNTLRSEFEGMPEVEFVSRPQYFPDGPIQIPLTIDETADTQLQHLDSCRMQDEMHRPHGLDELERKVEEQEDAETIKMMNDMTATFQSIRICGQILRNSYAGMKGDQQVEIISECYKACLRLIEVVMRTMVEERDDIAILLGKSIRERFPKIPDAELDLRVRQSVHGWALQICYSFVKHASNSLGLAALRPSFDRVMSGHVGNLGFRLLDISTRLDYFDGFPESKVIEVGEMLDEEFLGFHVLRILVWEHLKMFPKIEYRARQRVCSRLKILLNESTYIDPKTKRAELPYFKRGETD